jgi:hypothetical protein
METCKICHNLHGIESVESCVINPSMDDVAEAYLESKGLDNLSDSTNDIPVCEKHYQEYSKWERRQRLST